MSKCAVISWNQAAATSTSEHHEFYYQNVLNNSLLNGSKCQKGEEERDSLILPFLYELVCLNFDCQCTTLSLYSGNTHVPSKRIIPVYSNMFMHIVRSALQTTSITFDNKGHIMIA